MRRAIAVIGLVIGLVVGLAACAGKDGATGPTGPQGAQGPAGPAGTNGLPGPAGAGTTRLVLTGVASSSGSVTVALPAATGTDATKPPLMACYMTSAPSAGVWLAVSDADSATGAYCGLVFSNGVWNAIMNRMPTGWTAAFVVIY
jgi:hypothetical protein